MTVYPQFYRIHGIRYPAQVVHPPVSKFSELSLPKNSSIHLPQYNEEEFSIEQNHFLLRNVKKIMFAHITEFYNESENPLGGATLMPGNFSQRQRDYYIRNKRIKRLVVDKPITDFTTLVIYTYGMLNFRYRYMVPKRDTELNKWYNYWETVFTTLNNAVMSDQRNHFILLDVPTRIPSIGRLKQFQDEPLDIKLVRLLNNPDHWMVLSLWKFFGQHENPSYIFRNLKREAFERINIIFKHNELYTVLNLGKFVSYAQAFGEGGNYDQLKFNKLVLNMFLTLQEEEANVESLEQPDDEETLIDEKDMDEDGDGSVNTAEDINKKTKQRLDELFPSHIAEMTREVLDKDSKKSDKSDKSKKGGKQEQQPEPEEIDEDEVADEQEIEKRLEMLEVTEETATVMDGDGETLSSDEITYKDYRETLKETNDNYSDQAVHVATGIARQGNMTAGELRRATTLANNYKKLKSPKDPSKSFEEMLTVTQDDVTLESDNRITTDVIDEVVPDKSMCKSTLKNFDKKYISKVMDKHIYKSVMMASKFGITVQDYEVERVKTVVDDFEIHSIRVMTVQGKQSTIRFRIPTINEDGTFKVNGVRSLMRKQWSDLPIRKIGPQEVALSSYYSKLFVRRTERSAFNYEKWFTGELVAIGIDSEDKRITDVKLNNVFDNYKELPREYTMVSRRVSSFEAKGYFFNFNHKRIEELFGVVKDDKKIPLAYMLSDKKKIIYMDPSNGLIEVDKVIYTLEEFLGIDTTKAPIDYAEIDLYGKSIPLVYILGYQIGLGNLLATLKISYLRESKVTDELLKSHIAIKFKDEYLVVKKTDRVACLLLNGLNRFKNDIRKHSIYEFDSRDIYSTVFDNNGLDLRYLKECQTLFPLWVDHITKDVLESMGEPTDLLLLLIRACELLLTDYHPDSMDTKYLRLRGYERMAGFVYSEMVKSCRDYNYRPNRKDKAFTMHPDAIWYSILKDESVILTEQSNPIHSLKEQEITVYRGQGGRSSSSMMADARKFHRNGMGIISEATVDSKDVGTVVYLSSDPNLKDMYGRTGDFEKSNNASVFSTSAMLMPCADIDDPKRTGFAAVQNSQTMPAKNYTLLPVRTGYERVIAGRTMDNFCKSADMDGEVIDVDKDLIVVKYSDGSLGKYQVGTYYAPWSGKTVPQTLITDLNKGDKFKRGEVITYSPTFFKKDKLVKNHVSLTTQMLGRIALIEGGDVFEDACAISNEFSLRLGTEIAHIRNIVLDENQDITNLVKVGATVEPDSILCTILNTQTDHSFYDKQTIGLLERLASTSPKAKYKGRITKISALYTGDTENMNDGVKNVVIASDREVYRLSKRRGDPVENNRVNIGFRVDGKPLSKGSVVIQIHIIEDLNMGGGDKLVVANQLKCTISRVWTDDNQTEDGQLIDAYFSGQSLDNRIVNSPFVIGTTSTLLKHITKLAVDHYFSGGDKE